MKPKDGQMAHACGCHCPWDQSSSKGSGGNFFLQIEKNVLKSINQSIHQSVGVESCKEQ